MLRRHIGCFLIPLVELHHLVCSRPLSPPLVRKTWYFPHIQAPGFLSKRMFQMSLTAEEPKPAVEARAAGFLVYKIDENAKANEANKVQFLMMRASYEPFHWTPPKGHVDGTEKPLETALRETEEETGFAECDLVVDSQFERRLHYVARGKQKETIYFLARLQDPFKDATLSDEHTEARWVNAEEAVALGGFADMASVLREADAFIRASLKSKELREREEM
ncbi:hydrolase, NUDIX family protein [Toxoplasma gondii TgCatPRC2]|uniref:Bis(5'-nucleosyl)-tetraphosphatase [asymmetrical] n=3 Tax=Toxoplasma gondii TaxID=5811 RepID=A0A151HF61_TOXGO|nr:hydrolase, NUDIX family protein [Toxoplasma gondii ME49]EPT26517.1 hydrolase, NUDIX family protein [Toxoplasma gondii ME49]KFG36023.1 hydrolase, NUDIX family protein [Toxoplasma gondii GAB2-2007-GAL-DOM2]KYK67989.1 hydrolase, NUDIX family protein [Toxoplasma gondii TgCatPRC2]|eukprot:XP_002370799.1 hydrolase, NUDIX family protein [Toxoplasma gondii ME49]